MIYKKWQKNQSMEVFVAYFVKINKKRKLFKKQKQKNKIYSIFNVAFCLTLNSIKLEIRNTKQNEIILL